MARVGVAQVGSVLFDTPATLDRMDGMVEQARKEGVEFLVFPEAFIGGYPKGADFGATVGSRSDHGRDEFRQYYESSITVPGPETERIGEMARSLGGWMVVGSIERDGGTLYCTALYFSEAGELVGKHRKLMPTGSERLIWGFGDGSTIAVHESPYGRFGAAICWENYMPAFRASMIAEGLDLWCAPTVDDRDIWQVSMRHIAYEGRCFVLSACQYLTRADCPEGYRRWQGDDPATVLIRGDSVIVSPMGEVLAGPLYDEEGLITADIDLTDRYRGTFDLDITGHYARPDVFQVTVDTREKAAVRRLSDSSGESEHG
jgi:nitrilase